MDMQSRDSLFHAVLSNDVKAFGKLASPELFGAIFGHLPLLSLLYLYDANRIVRKYRTQLFKDYPRDRQDPFYAAEELFRRKAGKALRHFSGRDVSPLEMLAVLGKRRELARAYATYPAAVRALPMIKKIYFTRLGKEVKVVKEKLVLPAEPLSFAERKYAFRFAFILMGVGVAFAVLTGVLSAYFGWGTSKVYLKARNGEVALSAIANDRPVLLKKDVVLAGSVESSSSKIGGDGHILYLDRPFIGEFSGELIDVVVVIRSGFKGDAVITKNSGTISGVTFRSEGGAEVKSYIAENIGTIKDSTFEISSGFKGEQVIGVNEGSLQDVTFRSTSGAEIKAYISENRRVIKDATFEIPSGYQGEHLIAENAGSLQGVTFRYEESESLKSALAKNSGSLTDCRLSAKGKVEKSGEHASLLAVENSGVIENCVVDAEITLEKEEGLNGYLALLCATNSGTLRECRVTGSLITVNVDIAGIAGENLRGAKIENCVADMTLRQTSDLGAWTPNVAGICDENHGTISGCTVKGSVTSVLNAPDKKEGESITSAYAAGIACRNTGTIYGCTNESLVLADALNGAALAGGIVTLNDEENGTLFAGRIERCSGLGAVSASSDAYYAYAGGIAALGTENSVILACRQSAEVAAESGESYFSLTGGIVASSEGSVSSSFFTGSLKEESETDIVGAICGVIYMYQSFDLITMRSAYTIKMDGNAFVAGSAHASGGVYSYANYYTLRARTLYSAHWLESTEGYDAYVQALLEFGATAVTLDELKEMEIYYE